MRLTYKAVLVAIVSLVFGLGQATRAQQATMANASPQAAKSAVVVLTPSQDYDVTGVVYFMQTDKGVRVSGIIEHLSTGQHGFHVHEHGDCSGPVFKTASGHFNPTGKRHGDRLAEERHVGDLGNIEAGPDGRATIDFVDTVISLNGLHSIIGRGIIIHAGADDLESQPSGDAGARVACGTIGLAKVRDGRMK